MAAGKVVAVSTASLLGGLILFLIGVVVAALFSETEYGTIGYSEAEDRDFAGGGGEHP